MASQKLWINRPKAIPHEIPYKDPPVQRNPVLKGRALYYAAELVSNTPYVQYYLWSNAGFGILRNHPNLKGIEPRYEPVVVSSTKDVVAAVTAADSQNSSATSDLLAETFREKQATARVFYSILDYHEAYKSGKLTPSVVAQALLPLVRRDVKNATQHSVAFFESRVDLITKAAEESTKRYQEGRPLSPLDGVPVAVKDEADITGYRKCFGSKIDFKDPQDRTSRYVRLWLEAGAIMIGKTSMAELGMETCNNNPHYGTPVNPYNSRYYTGGSSGGSAYAVAAGLVPVAMGNDGGGSVRLPASYCGLFGLKPTHGRVSARPIPNAAKSTTVPGPLAANMSDIEISWRIMGEPDREDADARFFPEPAPINITSPSRPKILGIPKDWLSRAEGPVQAALQSTIDYLTTRRGYTTVDISLPLLHEGQLAHAMTIMNEAASKLTPAQIAQFIPGNKLLVSVGKQAQATDFLQAQKVRNVLMQHLTHLFDAHPGLVVVTPTTPNAGWSFVPADLTYGISNGNMQIFNMTYVWLANFTGCPSISAPVAFLDPAAGTAEGPVPVGFMGMGEWGSEDDLIALGYDLETYVVEELKGGRPRPGNFVDVFDAVQGKS